MGIIQRHTHILRLAGALFCCIWLCEQQSGACEEAETSLRLQVRDGDPEVVGLRGRIWPAKK